MSVPNLRQEDCSFSGEEKNKNFVRTLMKPKMNYHLPHSYEFQLINKSDFVQRDGSTLDNVLVKVSGADVLSLQCYIYLLAMRHDPGFNQLDDSVFAM